MTKHKELPTTICKVGDRIQLLEMPHDPDPIPIGTTGTVVNIGVGLYDRAQITIDWDIERSLMLIEGIDKYRIIGEANGGDVSISTGTG
ncbi:MAG TPA: DUF4314 domain-containing protein [Nitrososphaera sp.]|nr:DUF4314 domain-containing protein [Nitrososphaera sp.]